MHGKEVECMLVYNLAEPASSNQSSNWTSSCLLVPKSDDSDRFCTGFRNVNMVTKPDCYPLLRIEDCDDEVGNANFVTELDLLKGYWQVPLTREQKKYAVSLHLKVCIVMPFGLRNAPATFQQLMNKVLYSLLHCIFG